MNDWRKNEQEVIKAIEFDLNEKTKKILNQNEFGPQFQVLTKECLKQCERDSENKGSEEMIEYRAKVCTKDKVVEAVRAANFQEIQNVNLRQQFIAYMRFKRLLQEILNHIGNQLGELFKQEYLKLWVDWRSAKFQILEKDGKLKSYESALQNYENEQKLVKNKVNLDITLRQKNKQLEDKLQNLRADRDLLREELDKMLKNYEDLNGKYGELSGNYEELEKELESCRKKYEKQILELQQKLMQSDNGNQQLIDITKQLNEQLEKYKELYEKAIKRNGNLEEQLRYWKSTHQQRLQDLQNSECRIGSQKGYLFKYRREVEDLKRFKLQGEEVQKQNVLNRQMLYMLNQKQQKMQQTYEQAILKEKVKNNEKLEYLDKVLTKHGRPKQYRTETNIYCETQQLRKQQKSNQSFQEELQSYLVSYAKTPTPTRSRFRSESAKRGNILRVDYGSTTTAFEDGMYTEGVTPIKDSIYPKVRRFQTEK